MKKERAVTPFLLFNDTKPVHGQHADVHTTEISWLEENYASNSTELEGACCST